MPNKPGYYAEWYDSNRDEVAKRRKQRYEKDPEYRAKVLQRSSSYRELRRNVSQVRVPRSRHGKDFVVDDKRVHLYSIGAFADYINRSIQSINHWEASGLIPRTPYRVGKRGFRFYTADMIESVMQEVGNKRRLYPVDESMGSRIRQTWEDLGIPVDCEDGIEEAIRRTGSPKKPSKSID